MEKQFLLLSLLAALLRQAHQTCTSCHDTYTAAKKINPNPDNCNVAYTYIGCVDLTAHDQAGCPADSAKYVDVTNLLNGASCAAGSTLCECQKNEMQRLSVATNNAGKCSSYKQKIACIEGLVGAAGLGCAGSSVHASATVASNAISDISGDCPISGLCACEKDYAVTDITVTNNRCTAKKTFMACITEKLDNTACKSGDTVKILADRAAATIAADCGAGFTDSLCQCEVNYATADISGGKCPAIKTLIECVSGKNGVGCASGSTASSVTTSIADPNFSGCTPTDVCTCQKNYAGADISSPTNWCTAQKALVVCLYDKTTAGCVSQTPITLGNHVNTDPACTDFTTTACGCEVAYIRTDISDPTNQCAAKKTLLTCIMGKGAACNGDTAAVLAAALIDTQISAVSECSLSTDPTCVCEQNYAKATITTAANHCTALGTFVNCLKKQTTAGCSGKTVPEIGAIAETNYGTVSSECAIAGKTCECEVNYIKMPYSTTENICAAESYLVSCLKGRSDLGCDGTSTSVSLASAAKTLVVSECSAETDTCTACEIAYAETDITGGDATKCTALKTYMTCLKDKTANGCVTTETVPFLADEGETAMKAIGNTNCPITDTCQCEIDYIKAARTSDADKCSAGRALIMCVTEKTDLSCDGTTKPSDLATFAEGITSSCASLTETCKCEIAYAKVDQSAGPDCSGRLTFINCLSMAYDVGCDESTQRNTKVTGLDISTCSPTATCTCQKTYASTDYTDKPAQCSAVMAAFDCLIDKTTAGCDSGTSIIDIATHLDGRLTPDTCTITGTCRCQANDLMASKAEAEECTAHKTLLSCLMIPMDMACDGTTARTAVVTSIKDKSITDCILSDVCTNCMIAYGTGATSDTCTDVKTLMTCLETKNVYSDLGCDDAKTIPTIVSQIETATSCTYSDVCTCSMTYMKTPGTTEAGKCTALTTYLHCLDASSDSNCDVTKKRHEVATTVDGKIVDGGALTATCRTDLTTTCGTCQTTYAKADATVEANHCTQLYGKMGCLAAEPSLACLSSVQPHTLASTTQGRIDGIGTCATPTASCLCQAALAVKDIRVPADHCSARVAELVCLKDETTLACDETTTRDELDIEAKKAIDTIGTTDCPVTATCTCEIEYAKTADLSTDALKCAAWFTQLACTRGETTTACDGVSTREEIDNAILVKMDAVTTPLKCDASPICLCQIAYAVASKSMTSDHCTALKTYLSCLAGEDGTGCDGTATAKDLATEANTKLSTSPFDTQCVLSESCKCERDHAMADLSGGSCSALLSKMECLYSAEDNGCTGTARNTLATNTEGAISTATCSKSAVCDCMIPYAKIDLSTGKCAGLLALFKCLDDLTDPNQALTSCDGSKNVATLATTAKTAGATSTCPARSNTCDCIVTFLEAGTADFCSTYEAKIDCLTVSNDADCGGTARNTYAATQFTAYESVGSCAGASAGKVCTDCQKVYISAAPTCAILENYFQCIFDLPDGTSCNGKTDKQLVDEQDTNYLTEQSCTVRTACACQRTYLQSSAAACTSLPLLMDCLWEATDLPCGSGDALHTVVATAAGYVTSNTCEGSLSDVCACQVAFAKVDRTDPTALCAGIKAELQCLETETGVGCKSDRTIQSVATNANGLIAGGCTLTDTCTCQKNYLMADISGANACPEAEKKIACLYDTDTVACDGSTPRTTIVGNLDTVIGSCTPSSSCTCQRTYGKATGGTECDYKLGVITCLQDTTDAGCMAAAGSAVTRTKLGTDIETYLGGVTCSNESPTCQCQVDFAKATVDPTASLCSALTTLITCLSGKTDPGCDGSTKASVLAAAAFTKLGANSCPTRDTCDCEIETAKVDFTVTANICPALYNEMECIFDAVENGCDIAEARHTVAARVKTALGVNTCTTASTVCGTCIEDFATTDISSDICEPLRDFLFCLDESTGVSCKSPGALDISTLATNANTKLAANSCGTLTDTCQCQYDFLTRPSSMDACMAEAKLMECLVASTAVACDGTTTRDAYAATSHTDLKAVSGCEASLSDTCTACEIVYAKTASGCPALKTYFHCLDSKTATSCFGSKTIQVLAAEADTRAAADTCDLGMTCTCQANFLKSTDVRCTALKNKLSCLAVSFDTACDGTTTRDTVATTTNDAITSDTCSGVTDVCTCERVYAVEDFSVDATHCTNLKTAVGCLEGKTNAGCGATATVSSFATAVLAKITDIGAGTCPLTDTCKCQVEYLTDDISTPQLKCDALEKKQACLYAATTATGCDGVETRKDIITSVDSDITGTCTVPNSCRCQINYGKETVTPDTNKCDAMKKMVNCLQSTTDNGCVGTSTATRAELATVLETFAGSSGSCSLDSACTCQVAYGKADVTAPNICTSQKELIVCLGQANDNGCTGTASHTEADTFISASIGSGCVPAAGTTCKCQFDHAKMDRSTLPKACSAYAALIKCLETSTGLGCTGSETKNTIVSRIQTYMNDGANSCPISNTCACQIANAETNIDAVPAKCTALKTKLVCLKGTNDVACDGTTTKVNEATATDTLLNSVGGSCTVEDTCTCESTYAQTDTSSDTCTPSKTLLDCMMTKTEAGCLSPFATVGSTTASTISGLGGACSLTASCRCQQTFATTTDGTRCLAYKALTICLGEDNDAGCTGTSKVSLATTAEGLAKGISTCNAGLTSTCQCQFDYAKTDTSTNALKCTALHKELTCLFESSGNTCDDSQRKDQIASTVNTASMDGALSCPAKSDACTCATAYTMADISTNTAKCSAAKALLSCMSGVSGTGCDGVQSSTAITTVAETAIQQVVTAGGTCDLTDSCQCEVTFGKADPSNPATYCTAAVAYFACIVAATDVGCAGTANSALQSSAQSTISGISGCELPDTCECQERYRIALAGDSSQECKFRKYALNCLSTATENSCDGTKTKHQVTAEFKTAVDALTTPTCSLSGTCQCQVQYGQADVSDATLKCTAAQAFEKCVIDVQNDQEFGCDEITQNQHVLAGPVDVALQTCGGCSLSKVSVLASLLLVVLVTFFK